MKNMVKSYVRIHIYEFISEFTSQLGPALCLFAGPFEKKGGKYIVPPKFWR